ncbi:hypothetical protein B0T10DRAFT_605777 [Thelonectria olida]|uniref:Fungal STAND N-terminal Goodbye domain-containing protein n=1 Tax=Thelonectria olida TaxID=1576542 RepID=A0A9P8W6L9_9HYPO|nr:hypothetical protein B0T10DRAFT_605777 [Thelonectria olida]
MTYRPEISPGLREELEGDTRDIAKLWKDALKSYKGVVGFDLEKKFDDVQSMIDQGTKEMNNFHKFRHNEQKVDKLRSLFAANIDYLDKGAQQLLAAATPSFPPAAAIGTAVTYMLSACRQVSADYDVVIVFFEDMNSFLQRITILETRLPKYKAYQNCLMDVFTSFLSMCSFAHKYIELGRFKKWISNLLVGEDSELSDARKQMDLKLARLQNATEFAILSNTEELQKMSRELHVNQESHNAMLQAQMEVMGAIRDTTENIRSDMAKLLKAFDEQKKDQSKDQRTKLSANEQSKPPSAKRIRNSLPDFEGEDHEYHILKETMIQETCTWVFSEPEWNEWWAHGKNRVLAITGEPGFGKSHIGATIYDRLLEEAHQDTANRTCAAHFYFREQNEYLSSFLYGMATIINQVVEQSSPICELINKEYIKDEVVVNVWDWKELVQKLLAPAFRKESSNRLFVMFDGVDELSSLTELNEFLNIIKDEGLRISVVLTGRTKILAGIAETMETLSITVNKERQLQDLKALVWIRLTTLDSLRNFSRYVKQRIADAVEERSPNMLYAQYLLIRLNALKREGAVLKRLDKPLPVNLHEMYELSLSDCNRRTGPDRQQMVTKLLHWTAFSYRPLVLDEVISLLRYWANDSNFDIEEIPEPFSRFIRVGDPGSDAEARARINNSQGYWTTSVDSLKKSQDSMNPEVVYNDGSLPVKFLERSVRAFFREGVKTSTGRWSSSEAHRQMFLDCAKLARPALAGEIEVDERLRGYAAMYVFHHWCMINHEQHSMEEKAEVMEAFATILSNKYNYATMAERHGVDYKLMFTDYVFKQVATWAALLDTEVRQSLSLLVIEGCAGLAENPRKCALQIARGHLKNLYGAADLKTALAAFKNFHLIMELSHFGSLLAAQAAKNFKSTLGKFDEKEFAIAQAVLGLENVFGDIEMDATAYRAVATLLLNFKQKDPAQKTCQKAIKLSETPLDKVKSMELMARIDLKRGKAKKANEFATKCIELLQDETVPTPLRRAVYVTKARSEDELHDYVACTKSYQQARAVDPTNLTAGNVLGEEIDVFTEDYELGQYMDTLKNWSPLERLTWMAWKYEDLGDVRHSDLRNATVKTAEKEFVIQMYEDSIRYLDNVGGGAPLRCDLALVHLEVCENLEQARKVLDEVLDSSSTGWPYAVTEEYPESTLQRAIDIQTDILYTLFRQSTDQAIKAELLEAVEGLLTRPLALDVPPQSDTYLLQRRLVLARMYLKMGPAAKFQSTLQSVIDACLEALNDSVGWNDCYNLVFLAVALSILSEVVSDGAKLSRMARILASAQFSRLDPTAREDDDAKTESESGSDEGEDDWENSDLSGSESGSEGSGSGFEDEGEPPENEGDLYGVELICDGTCDPNVWFNWWGGRVAYQCLICHTGYLCEECYKNRQADNRGDPLKGRQYCGRNHKYIKLPIEGWQGIKDGKLVLEGEDPVQFKEILRQIREELCKESWGDFWRG